MRKSIGGGGVHKANHWHRPPLHVRRQRPRRRAPEQCDELAAFYPDHVNPRAYVVKVRLKRSLASLAYFVWCQTAKTRRLPFAGARNEHPSQSTL
jgi:hypothetical protein